MLIEGGDASQVSRLLLSSPPLLNSAEDQPSPPELATSGDDSQDDSCDHTEVRTLTVALLNFKSTEQVRERYLNKLFEVGLLRSQPSKKHQSIIIFDWDDTLLCTSYIGAFRSGDIPEDVRMSISSLEKQAIKVVDQATNYGHVFIVTNAIKGWIDRSCKLFMPKFQTFLKSRPAIQVVSAREQHEAAYPGDHLRWKMEAFKKIGNRFEKNITTNIISVGDSPIEGESAAHLSDFFSDKLLKTVKLRENPSPEELTKQLQLIYHSFEEIHSTSKNLTIKLEKKRQP